MLNFKLFEPFCCSNHIIRIDKYAMMCVMGISIFMPVYMFILHSLTMPNREVTWLDSCSWFVFNLTMTFTISFVLMVINVYVLHYLEARYPWRSKWRIHLLLEITAIAIYAPLIAILIHLAFIPFRLPGGNDLLADIIKTELYALIFNLMIVAVYEGAYLFKQWKTALIETEKLQKEQIWNQFETLRAQINPHFLFNSLNTLIGIIEKDPPQAIAFIKEFAKIYRSILDYKDCPVIALAEELQLVKSYNFLQKLRFGENLQIEINISAEKMQYFIPPFSVQLLIENALKHNVASTKKPLTISIKDEGEYLVVKNNLQVRLNNGENSTGIGLKNLKTRYELISELSPQFTITEREYIAKIPLIQDQYAPSFNY